MFGVSSVYALDGYGILFIVIVIVVVVVAVAVAVAGCSRTSS